MRAGLDKKRLGRFAKCGVRTLGHLKQLVWEYEDVLTSRSGLSAVARERAPKTLLVGSSLAVYATGSLSLRLTFLSRKLTFLSLKLTSLSLRLTFLSLKLTFLSLKLTSLSLKLTSLSLKLTFLSLKLTFLSLKLTYLR